MRRAVLNIADIPLEIECGDRLLPPIFKKFENNNKNPAHKIWRLESLGIDKNSIGLIKKSPSLFKQSSICFYFNDPVEINFKQRTIKHFCLKEDQPEKIRYFDSRLVTFVYSQILAYNHGILLHCAAAIKNGSAYLFFAKAGGGKSTVAQLSKKYSILGDDVIAIRKNNKDFLALATPWKQREFIKPKPSLAAKIKTVFFLNKSNFLSFKPLKPQEALIRVLSYYTQFLLYTERPLVKKIFFTAANFFKTIPAYEMYFTKDDNFWPNLEKIVK